MTGIAEALSNANRAKLNEQMERGAHLATLDRLLKNILSGEGDWDGFFDFLYHNGGRVSFDLKNCYFNSIIFYLDGKSQFQTCFQLYSERWISSHDAAEMQRLNGTTFKLKQNDLTVKRPLSVKLGVKPIFTNGGIIVSQYNWGEMGFINSPDALKLDPTSISDAIMIKLQEIGK